MDKKTSVHPKYNADLRFKAIKESANQITVDSNIPVRLYFHSGKNMVRMATIYSEEGKYEAAMILFMKYITLFVERLPTHPDYKAAAKEDKKKMKDTLNRVFPVAENIKNKVMKQFKEEEAEWMKEETTRQEQISKEMEQLRLEKEALDAQLRVAAERKWLDEEEQKRDKLRQIEVDKHAAEVSAAVAAAGLASNHQPTQTDLLVDISHSTEIPQIPDRDLKQNVDTTPSIPQIDRTNKPLYIDSPLSIHTSNTVHGLRTVEIPQEIMSSFLSLASSNTSRNIETCAMLTGKMANDVFRISHLIVPKQNGTSDTCDTENEEDIFDYQDKHDLFTLGWIHTHPTQTAFLSSIDMHTHCSYQLMLPEAIAVVCAPKFNETGIFNLSPDRGMPVITKCREKGFHHHQQNPPLFETCQHARLVSNLSIVIEDFRNK